MYINPHTHTNQNEGYCQVGFNMQGICLCVFVHNRNKIERKKKQKIKSKGDKLRGMNRKLEIDYKVLYKY